MTKQELEDRLNTDVYWLPSPLPEIIVPGTEIPSGKLTEVQERVRKVGDELVRVVFADAGHSTHRAENLYPDLDSAKAGLKAVFVAMKSEATAQVSAYDKLAKDTDQIGVYPEPEPEPEPFEM